MTLYRCISEDSPYYGHLGYIVYHVRGQGFYMRTWNRERGWDVSIWFISEWEPIELPVRKKDKGTYIMAYNSLL